MRNADDHQWSFGPFRLDGSRRILYRDDRLVRLSPKAADVLVVLIENHGQIVEKDELMKAVWPDTFVEETNLAVHVSQLRKSLGDEGGALYIETIPRRGYRFMGQVTRLSSLMNGSGATTAEANTLLPPSAGSERRKRWLIGGVVLVAAPAIFLVVRALGRRPSYNNRAAVAPSAYVTLTPSEKDSVVLADFANNTGEPVFNTTLRQAMAIELEQSPFLTLVSEGQMQQALQDMGKPADARLTPEISVDLCQRVGGSAVLDGWIAKLGTQYVLAVRATNCRSGDHIADIETNAAGRDQVLKALGDAIGQLRVKLGESLSMLQKFDTPIEEATTPSLEALQAYSIGRATMVQKSEDASCLPYFERAIRLDPDFAMAYAALGNAYSNLGEDGIAAKNISRAYALREHVSQRERLYIESHYFQFVTGDLDKARHAYDQWAATYPNALAPRTNLAVIDSNLGNFTQSLERAKEAVRLAPGDSQNYANLVDAYISLNQPRQARAVAEEAFRRNLDSPSLRLYLYDVAFLDHDKKAMQRQVDWATGEPGVEDSFLDHEGNSAAFGGQLTQARAFSDRASAAALRAGERETAAGYDLNAAQREALFGNRPQARRLAENALALAGDRDTKYGAAVALALAGETQRAAALAENLNRRFPEDTFVESCYLPTLRGAIAVQQKDPAVALKDLVGASRYEMGVACGLLPVYIRGMAYLQSDDGNRAALEFQKIVDHPGVVLNSPIGPLARLELGRSYALSGQPAKARDAYETFLKEWGSADTGVPVLIQAKVELQRLTLQSNSTENRKIKQPRWSHAGAKGKID
ncbi:MAG: winged helix-turn-helix domain-containing protein [Acidobacteriaceae bacterium]